MPKWSILICTVGQREERFKQLLKKLMPQVKKYAGEIEVLAYWNNAERPLGEIRQALVEEARGDYISFVDDDDMVPNYYCRKVMEAVQEDVDYVGWRMQLYHNGEKMRPTFHSLRYDRWSEDENGYYRNISHLNPIKREIALKASFVLSEKGVAEDVPWTEKVAPHVKTEAYIEDVMYLYQHTSTDSVWRGDLKPIPELIRPTVRYQYFRWHPQSARRFINGNPV